MQCLKSAADDGIGMALLYCGMAYFYGNGVEKDVKVGIDYLIESANQNNVFAADFLAEIYLTGIEVEKDIYKAEMYNNQANVPGNQNAQIRFLRITGMLNQNKIKVLLGEKE